MVQRTAQLTLRPVVRLERHQARDARQRWLPHRLGFTTPEPARCGSTSPEMNARLRRLFAQLDDDGDAAYGD